MAVRMARGGHSVSVVCTQCPAGQWETICNQSCEYCALGIQCDINSDNCLQCKAGHWSFNCTLPCGQCSDDLRCDINTLMCIRGCLPGRYGDNCTTAEKNAQEEEDKRKVVAIAASIGSFALCLVIVLVALPMYRKRLENQDKAKMMEMMTKQSEDKRNIIYTTLAGSHAENTTMNTAYEVSHIICTSNNTDARIILKDNCGGDIGDMAQSISSEKNVYHNEMVLNKAGVSLADLPHYFRKKTYDSKDLESEFEKLPKTPQSSMTNAQMPEKAKKNRYEGIYAYDSSRVELPTIKGIASSDGINACFIRGFEKKRAYITSQDPTEAIMDEFWRMIWHCGVDTIVMLTELVEEGSTKCAHYWPVEGKCIYGSTEVEYLTEDVFADYTIRKLKIQQEQYLYLHEAVVEALMPTMACVPSVRFDEKYQTLLSLNTRTGKCLLQTEFETLMEEENLRHSHDNLESQADEPEDGFTDATLSENGTKHRYDHIVPASNNNNNINAVILPSHKNKNALLLTQTPLPNTLVDFLRLVLDNEVHTIVMFDDGKTTEEGLGMYWPVTGGHASYGHVEVDVQSAGHTDSHQYRLLHLTRVQTGKVLTVMQFICTFWKQQKSTPPNSTQFLAFMEAIETWQRKNKPRPTVVHCRNGAERSGLYCVVSTILERLKIDREVAISSVIRQKRIRRPHIVPNYEQFKFCHDIIAEFLRHYETDSEFTHL